jgi:hypothetical protein
MAETQMKNTMADQLLGFWRDKSFLLSLTPELQLKLDRKLYPNFLVSAIGLSLNELSEDIEPTMIGMAQPLNVKVFVLMTAHASGRELTAWTSTPEIGTHLKRGIENLGLETRLIPSYGSLVSWAHSTKGC